MKALPLVLLFVCSSASLAQTNSPNAYGYPTGYGTVYGSYGLAATMQSMYNVSRAQMQKASARQAMVKKWGSPAVEKAEREAASGRSTPATSNGLVMPPPQVVRNHGVFRPVPALDNGKAFADALGDTPEERALIQQIFTATKGAYEKEAATKGWKNNVAGGLTLFTVTAMTVFHDAEEPSADAANNYFKVVNFALDEMPDFATIANKDKQGFNNMLIGFSGLLLAGYTEGKQNNDAATLASYRKLAGGLIQLVLKTDPENLRLENGQIIMK